MIKILVTVENNLITSLLAQGHADSDEYGHDLVCTAVSGIITGLCNALDILTDEENIILSEGYAEIQIAYPCSRTDLILRTALIQLQTVEEVNKDFLKIKVTEV